MCFPSKALRGRWGWLIGSGRTENNEHQIWHVVAAQHHQVAIINSATGAIASCPTGKQPCLFWQGLQTNDVIAEANDDGLLQLKGGEVALDGKALVSQILLVDKTSRSNKIQFTLIINEDQSVQFQNIANPTLCIDVAYSSPEDETPIICYECHPDVGENQNWNLIPVSNATGTSSQVELKIWETSDAQPLFTSHVRSWNVSCRPRWRLCLTSTMNQYS